MWLHRRTRRRTPFGPRFRDRFRRVGVERLEGRLLLAGDIQIELDPLLDQIGFQPETYQAYGDMATGSIFDTGASVVTFSAADQLLFEMLYPPGIEIKVPGGAEAEGIGGTLTGDVSMPGTIRVDGIHTLVYSSADIFSGELHFDELEGMGSVNDTAPTATQFDGDDQLSPDDDAYNGYWLAFTSGGLAGQRREIADYTGAQRTFESATPFSAAPADGDEFHILVDQGVTLGTPFPARDRLSVDLGIGMGDPLGRYLLFTSGDLEGEYQLISGYDATTHTVEFALPFSERPEVGDTFDIVVGLGSSAVTPGVQTFVGTLEGSEILPTISGTPMLNPSPLHPNGLALEVGPQEFLLDLGALIGDLDETLGALFEGITLPIPSVQFREPGTQLEQTESFFAESQVTTDTVAATATEFAGTDDLPYDPDDQDLYDGFFQGFHVRFLDGNLAGEIHPVLGYDAEARTLSFNPADAFSDAPAAGDTFELVRISTEPITVELELVGVNNYIEPGDIPTVSPNPVNSQVSIAHRHSGTVDGVTSFTEFQGSSELSSEDDWYNGMTLEFTSGPLTGEQAVVDDYVGSTRTFQLQAALPGLPDVDDAFDIVVGQLDDQTFLFDTGAMLSTISVDQAAEMGFDLDAPEFTMSVQGAAGTVENLPGFTMDELSIPTVDGDSLTFSNVPVFVIDVGEEIEGILGMNLFNTAAEFLYDPFDPVSGYPTLQITFFEQRSEVAVEEIDTSGLDPLEAALLASTAELLPEAFGVAADLREVALPGFGVGVDLDLTAQNGVVREEDGMTVVTVTPGTSIDFTAEVPYSAEFYDAFQLDFVGSNAALSIYDWNTDAVWTTTTDGTLSFPGDSSVSADGDEALSAALGTFVVDAPLAPGDYLLTADDGAGSTSFTLTGLAEPLLIRDFGEVIIRVQEGPSLSIGDAALVEGADGSSTDLELTVTRTGDPTGTVSVDYATADDSALAGTDYTDTSGTLQFAPGETEKTITVPIHGDSDPEAHEVFFVNLTNPSIDTGPLELTPISDVTAVDLDGTPYPLDETPFEQLESVNAVELRTDTSPSKRAFAMEFELTGIPAGATIDSATLTLVETTDTVSDPVNLPVAVYEYTGNADGAATLPHPFNTLLSNQIDTVGNGSVGTESLNVTSLVQSWVTNGDTYGGFYFESLIDEYYVHSSEAADSANRPKLTIQFTSTPVTVEIDDGQAAAMIRNDDTEISISDRERTEGDDGQSEAVFVVQLSKPSDLEVTVQYETSNGTATAGSDYEQKSGSLVFAPGETSKAISVAILGDMQDETDEIFSVELSSPTNAPLATSVASGTILDNDTAGVLIVETGDTEVVEGGATDTYTVALTSEPTHNVEIVLDPDAQLGVDPLGPLEFTPTNWHQAQTVTVSAVDDDVAEGLHAGTIGHSATSDDGNYDEIAIDDVTAQIGDNDSPPSIGSLADDPDPVEPGAELTLTALVVVDPEGDMAGVTFWRDANDNQTLDGFDEELGADTDPADGWSVVVSTASFPSGQATYFAQATDSGGRTSNVVSTSGWVGNTVDLFGTDGPDTITFATGSSHIVWINQDEYVYDPAEISVITIHAGEGDDSITITGSAEDETAELRVGSVDVVGATYGVHADSVEGILVQAGASAGDRAVLYDRDTTKDTFVGTPQFARMYGDGFDHRVEGFRRVTATSAGAGPLGTLALDADVAEFRDSVGADLLEATPESAQLKYEGLEDYFVEVIGFSEVHAFASDDGETDTAILEDQPGQRDRFRAWSTEATLFGLGFYNRTRNFDEVQANGSDWTDVAELHDSAGADLLEARPAFARLEFEGLEDHFVEAVGFRQVHAFASDDGETDTAILEDRPGQRDRFRAWSTEAKLFGLGYYNRTKGFDEVQASGSDWTDVAQLYDSSGADFLEAYADRATLTRSDGTVVQADDFHWLLTYASDDGENDTARLYDMTADLGTSYATWFKGFNRQSKMYGPTFYNRVDDFDEVIACAAGSNDATRLFDSSGSDVLETYADQATMSYADGTTVQADDFRWVLAYGSDDGQVDTARFHDTTADLGVSYATWFKADNVLSKMYSGTAFYVQARKFDEATASAVGDDDAAKLFDSALNDVYWSRPDQSRMEYADGTWAEALGFRYVLSYSRYGADTATFYDETSGGTSYAARFVATAHWAKLFNGAFFSRTEGFTEVRAATRGDDDLAWLYDDPARDDRLLVPFLGDSENAEAKAKFWTNRRVIYVDDFHTLTAITSEDSEDEKDIDPLYVDDVILEGNWTDAP